MVPFRVESRSTVGGLEERKRGGGSDVRGQTREADDFGGDAKGEVSDFGADGGEEAARERR